MICFTGIYDTIAYTTRMSTAKRLVFLAAALLFGTWLFVHWDRVTGDADAFIRFTLGMLFAILVVLRRKNPEHAGMRIPDVVFPLALAAGTLGALAGIIFRIHILEWAAVLLLLFACCMWIAKPHQRTDLALAFLVLFWVHPLPGQVFGWMQGSMQRLSVIGSERVLHVFNVRVWGDGIVLRAGYHNFLVPEACSGMRTSVTVFLCALGVGLLLRLRWWETLFFVMLGLAQVLVLNIARISYMVVWAPRMPPEWAEKFLHDTLGIFLLLGIVLVQFEACWWSWRSRRRAFIRDGIRRKELELSDKASIIPHPLRRLIRVALVLGGVGLVGFGVFAVVYKNRPHHRKEMIREVAEGLMETDPASAYRAIQTVRRISPYDKDLLLLQANTDFVLGRFDEGLAAMEGLEARGVRLGLAETIMKCWALTRIGRFGDARTLVGTLPPAHDLIPGVAMLKAEFAAMDGAPETAARHLAAAAASHLMLTRIRNMFPYLARHEQWAAIAVADHDRPYAEIQHALIALHSNQQVDNLSGLMRAMGHAIRSWPDDARLMRSLYELASHRQGGEWEAHFERNFRANIGRLSADALSAAKSYAWRLGRPDLAWLAHLYLERASPQDPELLMAPALFGQAWNRFRRHSLGVQAGDAGSVINLAPVLVLLAPVRPVRDFYRRIPMFDEALSVVNSQSAARRHLETGIEALARRGADGPLSERHLRIYPEALAMLGRYDEAHVRIDQLIEVFPEREADMLFQHAVYYDRQGEWQAAYEVLDEYRRLRPAPNLTAEMLRINALMNLNLTVCAMDVLANARRVFPGNVRLVLADAAIWDAFGYKEQALHVLTQSPAAVNLPVMVRLLHDTGRTAAAQQLNAVLRLGAFGAGSGTEPPMGLPPATLALAPRWPAPPDRDAIDGNLKTLRTQYETDRSPYIKALRALVIEWMEELARGPYVPADAAATAARVAHWEAAGRTPLERVGAVYELAMLAVRHDDGPLARAALRRGLVSAADNVVLWRVLAALSDGDADVMREAERRCPADPEIFLAGLVRAVKAESDPAARRAVAAPRVDAVADTHVFSPETLVRAGDYLLAEGMPDLAARLVRGVVPRARGLLAADVLDARTALMLGDAGRAQAAVVRGIETARDPTLFYRALVDIKIARQQVDGGLFSALEYLKGAHRDEPRWAEALGILYFQQGNMRRALSMLGTAIDDNINAVQSHTLLLAAEAARLDDRTDRALRILESAYALHPENVSVLNNLVYLLAQNPSTLARARALLPKLLEQGADIFQVLDTAAMVTMRSGDMAQAEVWMNKALQLLEGRAYAAHEVRLNAAELLMRQGNLQAAREAIEALRRDPARPDHVDQRARRLLRELESMP